ncbi:hypothetical protein AJ80_08970 [Polytolypa hystricis UAMH7299]|uniref:C2H2-type domain-containing protein n=1 Tax=Polytolypa hystricis (strain UAMH7299) TaxID=1447883 RepID=A0A2B7WYQ7_POLH7|nr:hypothetical protein AJ80_08970 [Polytolypa hystricis UAMH7299]
MIPRQRSRSARRDQRVSSTASELQNLSLGSQTPSPSLPAQHPLPEFPAIPSELHQDDGQLQGSWPSSQMIAAINTRTSSNPFTLSDPNTEVVYGNFTTRPEQFSAGIMSAFDYNTPPTALGQQQHIYSGHMYPQVSAYPQESLPSMPAHGYHPSYDSQIPQQPGLAPGSTMHLPSLPSSHYPVQQHERSTTPNRRVSPRVSRPSSRQDEYLPQGIPQSLVESYASIPSDSPSTSYMNIPVQGPTSHPYSAVSPLYNPSNASYSAPRQYYSTTPDPNLPPTSSPPELLSSSYGLSPGPDDQVRVVNSRPKPQCWDHGCNGREFSTFSNLLRHQREKAGTAAKCECPHCGTVFTRTTARNGHLAQGKCKAKRDAQASIKQ